jgi:DNA-binding GntR family transcriptional regulator
MRLEPENISARCHAILRERILAGDLAPGTRLHQQDLSRELGISRTPLREALGRLAADGLVDLLPNRGARVADVRPADMEAAYQARLTIEPAAARLAGGRGGEAVVAPMRAAIAAHRAALHDLGAAFRANRAFHLALVEAGGNPYLVRFAETLWTGRLGMRVYETQDEPPEFIARDADEHEAIADAIAAREPDRAQELTRRHIACAMELLVAQLARDVAA